MRDPDLDPSRYDFTTEGSCDEEGNQCEGAAKYNGRGDYVAWSSFEDLLAAYNELKLFYDTVKEAL